MLGNAGKHVILSSLYSIEYKLYTGHIHTLVLTREWIAMLAGQAQKTVTNADTCINLRLQTALFVSYILTYLG